MRPLSDFILKKQYVQELHTRQCRVSIRGEQDFDSFELLKLTPLKLSITMEAQTKHQCKDKSFLTYVKRFTDIEEKLFNP